MEYLHATSLPASKSELQIFNVPPTQTVIESSYEVEYRPSSSLESSRVYEINIPGCDDFTDLSATMVNLHVQVFKQNSVKLTEADPVRTVQNFANALFEQVDLAIGSVNTVQANNMYHYQAYIEDLFFRHTSGFDDGFQGRTNLTQPFDLYFRLHLPLCEQDKLMLNGVPFTFRFSRSPDAFALIKTDSKNLDTYNIKITKFSLHIKRVRLFPEALKSIVTSLEKGTAKYFITRNDTKHFSISSGLSVSSTENIYNGILPRRMVVALVKDIAHKGSLNETPWGFKHFNVNYIALNVDGAMVPSIPYTPNFTENLYMREFVDLFRTFNQDEGDPQLALKWSEYSSSVFYAFDLTPDGSIGAENGTLSLIKRGNIRLDIKFAEKLSEPLKIIVFAQFDNLITIDRDRKVTLDY